MHCYMFSTLVKAQKHRDFTFLLPKGIMAASDCYVWPLRKAHSGA